MAMIIYQYLAVAVFLSTAVGAWNVPQGDRRSPFSPYAVERRDVLTAFGGAASSTLLHPFVGANAADSAAIDGKLRTVELLWDDCPTGRFPAAVDGINSENTPAGTAVSLSYKLPDKWDDCYVDRINKQKACNKILVYQKTGSALPDALDKAASGQWKISRALDIGDRLDPDLCRNMKRAEVISQRTTFKDMDGSRRAYYEFDLTVTPDDDLSTKYDIMFLVSATVLNKRLFVCIAQCDEAQLKRGAGSDLQLVRSSFQVKDA